MNRNLAEVGKPTRSPPGKSGNPAGKPPGTLEQAIPGGMSLEDYSLMREVIAAIREGLPEADQMQPDQVFQHVLEALQNCPTRAPPG